MAHHFERQTIIRLPANVFCLFVLLAICISGYSQDFGGYPTSTKWLQLKTPAVRVIFPEGLNSQSQRVANIINYLDTHSRQSIGNRFKKLDLVMNHFGVESNGYVTIGPFHSQLYLTPLPDSHETGSLNWIDFLAIHEYRHALQYMNQNRSWFRVASTLFGDYGLAVLMNITVPNWYYEGDAVVTETALTPQGRGRVPAFLKGYRSIILDDKRLSYEKARNGSYKDLVPNHYPLGYLLCAYGRERYGNDLWMHVNSKNSKLSGIIYPFSQGLQFATKKRTAELFRDATDHYREQWLEELDTLQITESEPFSLDSKVISYYHYPRVLENGNILVYKRSYRQTGAFYEINESGVEKLIAWQGLSYDPYFSSSAGKITWCETSWHPRFSALSYNDVIVYDITTRSKKYITRHGRYFSPSISLDGEKIVVVKSEPEQHCSICILKSNDGSIIHELPNPDNFYFTYPQWSASNESIISSVRSANGEMAIVEVDIFTGHYKFLLPFHNQVIGPLSIAKNRILFAASFSGIDNIYTIKNGESQVYQLTSSSFGAYEPFFDQESELIYFTEFHRKGQRISNLPLTSALWEPRTIQDLTTIPSLNPSFLKEEGGNILDQIEEHEYQAEPYKPGLHLFKLHSWSIVPDFQSIGFHLFSDNTLNQLSFEGGYDYYFNEKAGGFSLSARYGGLFPILSLEAARQFRSETIENQDTIQFQEYHLGTGVQIPLNLSKGINVRQIILSAHYDFVNVRNTFGVIDGGFGQPTNLNTLDFSLLAINRRIKAHQQLTTPFGQSLQIDFYKSILGKKALQLQVTGDLALKGLIPTHNLTLTGSFKSEKRSNKYHFLDQFIYPRGFSIPEYDQMLTLLSSYHFPLLYPDFGIIGIVYFKRIRASLFADGAIVNPSWQNGGSDINEIKASIGVELIFDTRWLNFAPISLGIRSALLLTPDNSDPSKKFFFEFFLPVFRL